MKKLFFLLGFVGISTINSCILPARGQNFNQEKVEFSPEIVTQCNTCTGLERQLRAQGESYYQMLRQINEDQTPINRATEMVLAYIDPSSSARAQREHAKYLAEGWNTSDRVNIISEVFEIEVDCERLTGIVNTYLFDKNKQYNVFGEILGWEEKKWNAKTFWRYGNGQWYRTLRSAE